MNYSANVYKVFIASPSDVDEEREIIREVLARWNAINSEKYKIVLLPVGWETHSSPEMGKEPQKIINERLLENCDLLIGVFWTRFGTPTDDYDSGTQEEIEEHIKSKKPTMLYFSNKPVVMDSVDQDQYEKLQDFKESCKNRGLYEVYSTLDEFSKKLFDHLQLKVNQNEYFNTDDQEEKTLLSRQNNVTASQLSEESKELLKEAADAHSGYINIRGTAAGKIIVTNQESFGNKDAREQAKWKKALQDLERSGLVESANAKRNVFKITHSGYELADKLNK